MPTAQSKNTKPELSVRKFLYDNGIRYRLHNKNIIGKPDISINKYKITSFMKSGGIPVITGFQGINLENRKSCEYPDFVQIKLKKP